MNPLELIGRLAFALCGALTVVAVLDWVIPTRGSQ